MNILLSLVQAGLLREALPHLSDIEGNWRLRASRKREGAQFADRAEVRVREENDAAAMVRVADALLAVRHFVNEALALTPPAASNRIAGFPYLGEIQALDAAEVRAALRTAKKTGATCAVVHIGATLVLINPAVSISDDDENALALTALPPVAANAVTTSQH